MADALVHRLQAARPEISVGMLAADWMNLGSELKHLESAGVQMVHFDVMDGCFCPMLTMGASVVAGLKTSLLKDVHLMVEEPLAKVEAFVAAGADIVTVHVESTRHVHRVLQTLGRMTNVNDAARKIVRGVALNPGTPLEAVDPLLDELDYILVLAVNPGWGGQKFIAATKDRLSRLRQKVGQRILLGIDGGITRDNIADVARAGADIIVTGSAVFDGKAPAANAHFMINAIKA